MTATHSRPALLSALLSLVLGALCLLVPWTAGAASAPEVLQAVHTDALHTTYDGSALRLASRVGTGDYREADPAGLIFNLEDRGSARVELPDLPAFSFLGTPGSTVWMAPESQDPELIWPGWDTETIPAGALRDDAVDLTLLNAEGPGAVEVFYNYDEFTGAVPRVFSSVDPAFKTLHQPVGRHVHANWSFAALGTYRLTFQASAVTAAGVAVTSGPVTYTWVVGTYEPPSTQPCVTTVLSVGHVDVAARTVGDRLRFQVKDGTHGTTPVWRDPATVAFQVKPEGDELVPDDPRYRFLGSPGATIWQIPQTQAENLLWAGWNTESVDYSKLSGPVHWSLDKVEGPGKLAVFQFDQFGGPLVSFDSANPLPQSIALAAPTHAHGNWAFTHQGLYRLTFTYSATTKTGQHLTDTATLPVVVGNNLTPLCPTNPPTTTPTPCPTTALAPDAARTTAPNSGSVLTTASGSNSTRATTPNSQSNRATTPEPGSAQAVPGPGSTRATTPEPGSAQAVPGPGSTRATTPEPGSAQAASRPGSIRATTPEPGSARAASGQGSTRVTTSGPGSAASCVTTTPSPPVSTPPAGSPSPSSTPPAPTPTGVTPSTPPGSTPPPGSTLPPGSTPSGRPSATSPGSPTSTPDSPADRPGITPTTAPGNSTPRPCITTPATTAPPPPGPSGSTPTAPTPSTTQPATASTTLSSGHADYAVRLVAGALQSRIKDGTQPGTPVWRDPSTVTIRLTSAAGTTSPGGAFSFLGPKGTPVWQIPQTQKQGVIWLGWNTEELKPGQVPGNTVTWRLDKVTGPGRVSVFEFNSFGQPQLVFNSADGLPDTYQIPIGTHAHGNWSFTKPGTYNLTFTHSTPTQHTTSTLKVVVAPGGARALHLEHASTTFARAKWSSGAQGGAERLVGAQGAGSGCGLAATGTDVRVGWFVAAGLFILLGGVLLVATRRGAK
ncbi:choice-of-anchor M domain-containing protein [Kribbella sp. NPDC051587]|uniref:choice-of-anchor M domain-containing protein n=1 Tax=Kribbella sp. NPDC051587 TaxID=3364119 RepID=UPI0037957AD1